MARRKLYGLEERHELDSHRTTRDTRTVGMRIHDFFHSPSNVAILLVLFGTSAIICPALADILFIVSAGIFAYTYTRNLTLPFRMPKRSGLLDHNDPKPGSGKPYRARGIAFFGNEIGTNQELWFTNDDMRTHVLIFGSTGSGKTETLVSLAYNALLHGSGFIYVDGKGDNNLYSKVFSMVRSMGRGDDLLIINFMTGARDIVGPQEKRLSNTMNPFSTGSSSMLAQLVVSLMDGSSSSGDGDMWKGRAIGFVEAMMRVLVYARDREWILLDANTIRNYFSLERIEIMVLDKQLQRDDQEPANLADVPEVILEPIKNYLINLPGYDKSKKGKQVSQVLEQHGFITMQLTRVFTSMADTYGHILRTNLAEVDIKDVVLNRRVLVVLLPALEKSPEELSNLGKIIVASLKAMMASGLGEDIEGDYTDVIARKPTNAPTPYLCILDEYGYYAVEGFAVVPAQARSLGFSAIFSGQDLPAFQKASKEEAASIGANTNIKICMKLEDPVETYEFFSKTAGEAYVTKVDSFQTKETSVMNDYNDTRSASLDKRSRIDLKDLKEQDVGEAHLFFKSKIVRYKTFFANPPPVKKLRLNQFLKVGLPATRKLIDLESRQAAFLEKLTEKSQFFTNVALPENDLTLFFGLLKTHESADPIETCVNALLAYHTEKAPKALVVKAETLEESECNIFVPLRRLPGDVQPKIITEDLTTFSAALIDKKIFAEQIEAIERFSGKSDKQARNITEEMLKDFRSATHYPPELTTRFTAQQVIDCANDLVAKIEEAVRNNG